MSEKVETIPQKVETILQKVDENVAEHVTPEAAPVLAPKKMGRPAGAKDRAPRKKKITIVEERLAVPEPPPQLEPAEPLKIIPSRKQIASPPRPMVELAYEPPSPRTVRRQAYHHVLELKGLESSARKTNLGEIYSRGLRGF